VPLLSIRKSLPPTALAFVRFASNSVIHKEIIRYFFALVSDAFALSRAGKIPLFQVLDLVLDFADDMELPVWNDININMTKVASFLQRHHVAGVIVSGLH